MQSQHCSSILQSWGLKSPQYTPITTEHMIDNQNTYEKIACLQRLELGQRLVCETIMNPNQNRDEYETKAIKM